MTTKKTAVEWLVLQFGFQGRNNQEMLYVKQMVEQAKAMEKEQIMDAFRNGLNDWYDKDTSYYENAEQYYNETYGKEK